MWVDPGARDPFSGSIPALTGASLVKLVEAGDLLTYSQNPAGLWPDWVSRLPRSWDFGAVLPVTTPSAVILPGERVMTWSDRMAEKVVEWRKAWRGVEPEGQMGLGIY